jgi:hypothetical protein
MTQQQYLRQFSCVIADASGNGLDFSDFQVRFNVRRGDYQAPNSCDVRIFNVADNTANQIQNEFTQIVLQAGYEGSYGVIFLGTIKQVRKGRVDAKNSYVDVTAGDGDSAYNFATCSFSLAAGTTPANAVQALLQSLIAGSLKQQISAQSTLPPLPTNGRVRGRVFYGMTRDAMRELCRSYGLKWSIQDGVITLIPLTGYLPGPIPVLSPDTGLIGVPEQTQQGIEMRVLLNSNIKIGQLVQLQSASVNLNRYGLDTASQAINDGLAGQIKTNADGYYYVMVANHSGETRGNDWYTDLTCLAVDATLTSPFAPPTIPIPATTGPSAVPVPAGGGIIQ